ncbi:MAG: AmmeMemoRadiSam system protein A [Anaerolineae bacterium]|jgi:AmmeMemoRadiSam system protein A
MNARDLLYSTNEQLDTPHLSQVEKEKSLQIVRETLTQYLTTGTIPDYADEFYEAAEDAGLLQKVAAFVTLRRRDGELRGCIGRVEVSEPLYRTLQDCVISAATSDFRFPPVTASELDEILIEISALSPFRPIRSPDEIQVGRHGLLIRKDFRVGLLLPQVASDRGWSRDEFLRAICLKAGLPTGAWRDADLYVFSAEVFEEEMEQ